MVCGVEWQRAQDPNPQPLWKAALGTSVFIMTQAVTSSGAESEGLSCSLSMLTVSEMLKRAAKQNTRREKHITQSKATATGKTQKFWPGLCGTGDERKTIQNT